MAAIGNTLTLLEVTDGSRLGAVTCAARSRLRKAPWGAKLRLNTALGGRSTNMGIARIALLLVALLPCCRRGPGEDFTEVKAEPETLIGTIRSYSDPGSVAAALGGPAWQVTERSGLKAGDKRPPFNMLSVVVAPYHDRGCVGELHLTFFNSRLESASFYPDDLVAYRATLGAFPSRSVRGGELRKRHLRVWNAVDHQGREYFFWGDDRLMEQERRWIRNFS
jgi:hypothetical protein